MRIRSGVCRELDWFGIELDPALNQSGPAERVVSTTGLARAGLDACRPTKRSWSPASRSNCSNNKRKGDRAMFLARVTGSVVATQKVASMTGHKLLTVEPYRVDEKARDRLVPTGRTFVVVDTLGAGVDEMVLICQGSSARLTPETEKLPIDAVVIGLVDTVDVGGQVVFRCSSPMVSGQWSVVIVTDDGARTREGDGLIPNHTGTDIGHGD